MPTTNTSTTGDSIKQDGQLAEGIEGQDHSGEGNETEDKNDQESNKETDQNHASHKTVEKVQEETKQQSTTGEKPPQGTSIIGFRFQIPVLRSIIKTYLTFDSSYESTYDQTEEIMESFPFIPVKGEPRLRWDGGKSATAGRLCIQSCHRKKGHLLPPVSIERINWLKTLTLETVWINVRLPGSPSFSRPEFHGELDPFGAMDGLEILPPINTPAAPCFILTLGTAQIKKVSCSDPHPCVCVHKTRNGLPRKLKKTERYLWNRLDKVRTWLNTHQIYETLGNLSLPILTSTDCDNYTAVFLEGYDKPKVLSPQSLSYHWLYLVSKWDWLVKFLKMILSGLHDPTQLRALGYRLTLRETGTSRDLCLGPRVLSWIDWARAATPYLLNGLSLTLSVIISGCCCCLGHLWQKRRAISPAEHVALMPLEPDSGLREDPSTMRFPDHRAVLPIVPKEPPSKYSDPPGRTEGPSSSTIPAPNAAGNLPAFPAPSAPVLGPEMVENAMIGNPRLSDSPTVAVSYNLRPRKESQLRRTNPAKKKTVTFHGGVQSVPQVIVYHQGTQLSSDSETEVSSDEAAMDKYA